MINLKVKLDVSKTQRLMLDSFLKSIYYDSRNPHTFDNELDIWTVKCLYERKMGAFAKPRRGVVSIYTNEALSLLNVMQLMPVQGDIPILITEWQGIINQLDQIIWTQRKLIRSEETIF